MHGACIGCGIVHCDTICLAMQAKITYLRLEKLELAGLEREADGGE